MKRTVIAIVAFGGLSFFALTLILNGNTAVPNVASDSPARLAALGKPVQSNISARHEPLHIAPANALPELVSESQLLTALCSAMPNVDPPNLPVLIHELKLWGAAAEFPASNGGRLRSGAFIVETLLSDKLCRERTSPNGASYLVDSPLGINVVLYGTADSDANRGEAHCGQLLKALAQANVPISTPVTTSSGTIGSVADLLRDAILRYPRTEELEFVGCAFALWLPPAVSWVDQFNNRHTFDELALRLCDAPMAKGSCGGCHIPYALTILLRVDQQYPILSPDVRTRVATSLRDVSARLERAQGPNGGWGRDWLGPDHSTRPMYLDDQLDRICITGHHLEWMALASDELRPSKSTISRAVASLVTDIETLSPTSKRTFKSFLPCSHAARALALLAGTEPAAALRENWHQGRITTDPEGYWVPAQE